MKHASLRKPKHKELVVATSKGWVVERTGELLVSIRGLDQKLKETLCIDDVDHTVVDLPTDSNLDDELNNLINTISMVAGEKLKQESDESESKSDQTEEDVTATVDETEEGESKSEEVKEEQPVVEKKKRGRPAKPKPTDTV